MRAARALLSAVALTAAVLPMMATPSIASTDGQVVPPPPATMSVTAYDSFIADTTGHVSGAGGNYEGELGSPITKSPSLRSLPAFADGARPVALASTPGIVAVVGSNGKVYGSGDNSLGQLTGTVKNHAPWTELSGLPADARPIDVEVSQECTVVLTADGRLFRTGKNTFNECPAASGADLTTLTPMPGIPDGRRAVDVSLSDLGYEFILVLLDNGTILGSGDNSTGALPGKVGNQSALTTLSPLPDSTSGGSVTPRMLKTSSNTAYAIGDDGQAYKSTSHGAGAAPTWDRIAGLPAGRSAVEVAGTGSAALVLDDLGVLHAVGSASYLYADPSMAPNSNAPLWPAPVPAGLGPITEVEATSGTMLVRGAGGLVWGAGSNSESALTGDSKNVNGLTRLTGQALTSTSAPVVSGSPSYGHTLAASPGTYNIAPDSVAYQWLRNGLPIPDATLPTYAVQKADLGQSLSVNVVAHSDGLTDATATSAPCPVATQIFLVKRPTITGTAKIGHTLKLKTHGTWTINPTSYTYRWLRGGKPISHATKRTYKLTKKDKHHTITLQVTAKRSGYISATATSSNHRKP